MKPAEIRDLSRDEVERKLAETKEEFFNLRFQLATGQLDNYRRLRGLKRDVARLQTALREHELQEASTGQGDET